MEGSDFQTVGRDPLVGPRRSTDHDALRRDDDWRAVKAPQRVLQIVY